MGDETVMTAADHLEHVRGAREELLRVGRRSGPVYNEAPLVWYDQVFEREATPTGAIEGRRALRVGSTQNALDVIVVASHKNGEDQLTVSAGATFTLSLLQSDEWNGKFEAVGPTICITANEEMKIDADCLVCRFAIGNMSKQWAKVRLEVTGVTGGLIDIALSYVAR